MKKLFFLLVCVVSLTLNAGLAVADSAKYQMVIARNDGVVDGEFHATVQMRITNGESPRTLNSLTMDISYGSQLSEYPGTPAYGVPFGSADGYSLNVVKPFTGRYRFFVTGNDVNKDDFGGCADGSGSKNGFNITSSWQNIITFKWIINQATYVNIQILDESDAAAYFLYLANNPCDNAVDWDMSNDDLGDVSLPVELSSFTATSTNGCVTIDWVTQSETDNLGFNVQRSEQIGGPYQTINSELIRGSGNSTTESVYKFIDEQIEGDTNYFYKLEDIDTQGRSKYHGPIQVFVEKTEIPDKFSLDQNYPNPFNPSTIIQYGLPVDTQVKLRIYNVRGELIRLLVNTEKSAGVHQVEWDGRNDNGMRVPTGLYFYKIETNSFTDIKKLIFTK